MTGTNGQSGYCQGILGQQQGLWGPCQVMRGRFKLTDMNVRKCGVVGGVFEELGKVIWMTTVDNLPLSQHV